MAILSADVIAGADILASSYNNLRSDLLTNDIAIAGVKTFSDDLYIAPLKKLYLDGGGDTYIVEGIANFIHFYAGAALGLTITSNQDITIEAAKKLFLDSGNNTYIYEKTNDEIRFVANNTESLFVVEAGIGIEATQKIFLDGGGDTYILEDFANQISFYAGASNTAGIISTGLWVNASKKLWLDGGTHTYIQEDSADNIAFFTGGTLAGRFDANQDLILANGGIAPGGNEVLRWDVVIISLDGTSPDSVSYVTDESKIKGLVECGHATSANADGHTTATDADLQGVDARIIGDSLSVNYYDAAYGSGDTADIVIFYTA